MFGFVVVPPNRVNGSFPNLRSDEVFREGIHYRGHMFSYIAESLKSFVSTSGVAVVLATASAMCNASKASTVGENGRSRGTADKGAIEIICSSSVMCASIGVKRGSFGGVMARELC